ncbi:hypothetical protein L1987_27344 [Smallanthus sonchifolius]|uniref:Uncharacterized protein n=1 Tax=Smallanthus sonchifolius TaxID=185202 RepID=A0ACB9IAA9_9ASTR|nr:hypothetical protein L1987_27344 [Smallanthus sonchifolius]
MNSDKGSRLIKNCMKWINAKEMWKHLKCHTSTWERIFVPLRLERDLIKRLSEAKNSLQQFHNSAFHGSHNITQRCKRVRRRVSYTIKPTEISHFKRSNHPYS